VSANEYPDPKTSNLHNSIKRAKNSNDGFWRVVIVRVLFRVWGKFITFVILFMVIEFFLDFRKDSTRLKKA